MDTADDAPCEVAAPTRLVREGGFAVATDVRPLVIPAVLTDSEDELKRLVATAARFASRIQVDFMDGEFVDSMSVPVETAFGFEAGEAALEAHLMVREPTKHFGFLARAHYQMVIFHVEADDDPLEAIETARGLGLAPAVAINPDTDLEKLEPLIGLVDEILFMTVHPGYYGRPIVWEAVERAAAFKRGHPDVVVAIDGGVKADNFPLILDAGFDRVCVGSAILKAADPEAAYHHFVHLAASRA